MLYFCETLVWIKEINKKVIVIKLTFPKIPDLFTA